MRTRWTWFLGLVWLSCVSSSCAPIRYAQQGLLLRHDEPADTLEVLIVYDAIEAQGDEDKAGGVGRKFADHVSGGRREFMIYDWPLHFDVDEFVKQDEALDAGALDPWKSWKRDLRAQVAGLQVIDSGYCLGSLDRLSLYQHLKLGKAEHLVALFDRGLDVAIDELVAQGRFEEATPWLDARSRELWIAMAKGKQRWLSLKQGVLTAELPATSACAAAALRGMFEYAEDHQDFLRFTSSLSAHLSELSVAGERLVLRWKLDGAMWNFKSPEDHDYDDGLARALIASKALPEKLPSRAEVAEKFRGH